AAVAPEPPPAPPPTSSPTRRRDARHVRAVPTNAQVKVERALELFNSSEHVRTIGGIARTLGEPWVCATPLHEAPSEVAITVAWELSWYRYRVDLGGAAGPAAPNRKMVPPMRCQLSITPQSPPWPRRWRKRSSKHEARRSSRESGKCGGINASRVQRWPSTSPRSTRTRRIVLLTCPICA